MKKRVFLKNLYQGDPNLITKNEILYKENNGIISLSKRQSNNIFKEITGAYLDLDIYPEFGDSIIFEYRSDFSMMLGFIVLNKKNNKATFVLLTDFNATEITDDILYIKESEYHIYGNSIVIDGFKTKEYLEKLLGNLNESEFLKELLQSYLDFAELKSITISYANNIAIDYIWRKDLETNEEQGEYMDSFLISNGDFEKDSELDKETYKENKYIELFINPLTTIVEHVLLPLSDEDDDDNILIKKFEMKSNLNFNLIISADYKTFLNNISEWEL